MKAIQLLFISSLTLYMGGLSAQIKYPVEEIHKALQARLDSLQKANGFPGATLSIVLPNNQQITVASGFSDKERGTSMSIESRMLSGSNGKTYFAAIAMHLMERGYFRLDDKIYDYLKDEPWINQLPNANQITFRHLLNHSSGLAEYYTLGNFMGLLKENPKRTFSHLEVLQYVFNTKSLFKAGTDFGYADTNYILMGYLLEKITQQNLYNLVNLHILKPYNLKKTEPSPGFKFKHLAVGYARANGPFPFPGPSLNEGLLVFNPQFEWTGGGFVSNTQDLAKWMKTLYNLPLLQADTRAEMRKGIPAKTGRDHAYGLGIQIRPHGKFGNSYGHSGWYPGYITDAAYFPDSDLSIAIQFNTDQTDLIKKATQAYLTEFIDLTTRFLPTPSGKYSVGYTTLEKKGTKNTLQFQIWYPSTHNHETYSNYLPSPEWVEAMIQSNYNSLTADELLSQKNIKRNATYNAAIKKGKFPVVFFSHGHGMSAIHYSMLFEQLASMGYIIVAPNYYLGGLRLLSDGTIETSRQDSALYTQKGQEVYEQRIVDWAQINEEIWQDIKKMSPYLKKHATSMDLKRLFTVGHSLGGNTAAYWMIQNKEIKAAMNMDGGIFIESNEIEKRPLWILRSLPDYSESDLQKRNLTAVEWKKIGEEIDQSFAKGFSHFKNKKEFKLKGVSHLSFSDAPFVLPNMVNKFGGNRISPLNGFEQILNHLRTFLASYR